MPSTPRLHAPNGSSVTVDNKLGGSVGMLPRENFTNRCSKIASVIILASELVDGLAPCTTSNRAIEAVRNITSHFGPLLVCATSQ